jgi:AcrR family transcriptional regulator
MPKVVDHDERRREIAEAMWRVISREGLAAASARSIAAEGGWSLGAVRHYFSSQDELMVFAARAMVDAVIARLERVVQARGPGQRRCAELLEQLLPLDDERTAEVRVWLAVLIRSHVDESLAEVRMSGWEGTRELCRGVVAELAGRGPGGSGVSARRLSRSHEIRAERLHAWLDGLTLHAITVPEVLPPDDVRRLVRRELSALARELAGGPSTTASP